MIAEDQRWGGLHLSRCQHGVIIATEEQLPCLSLSTQASVLYESLRAQTQALGVWGLGLGSNWLRMP